MSDFQRFKEAVALLSKHLQVAKSHEDVAKGLIGDDANDFHSYDLIAYVGDLDNTIQVGLSAVIDSVDPGVEEGA